MPTHTAAAVRPPTPAECLERRTVVLFLLALAARPVEGEEVPDGIEPPPAYFHRAAVCGEWSAVANTPNVRRAMRRKTGARALGRTGFVAVLRQISEACRAANSAERAEILASIRDDYDAQTSAAIEAADEAEREHPHALLTDLRRERDEALAEVEVLPAHVPDNEVAVAHRTSKGADLIRLRRDLAGGDAPELWERLADIYGGPDSEPAVFEDLLEEATSIGFDTSSPLPSSALCRVAAWTDDDEDDDEDQADEPPVAPRPAPAPEPAPSARWTCAACGTASTWQSPNAAPWKPCSECDGTIWH